MPGHDVYYLRESAQFKTVAKIIRDTKPGLLVGTPVFLEGYIRQSEPGDFDSIKLAVSGADKCPDTLRQLYREKAESRNP